MDCTILQLRYVDLRFAKPRNFPRGNGIILFAACKKNQKARTACGPDRGILSVKRKVPERETDCYFLRCAKSNAKSTRDFVLRPRFKTLRNTFFVILPALVPIPVCGATRFFGCFEPVRKGCCSADARLMFFENRMLYSKLTGANVF